MHGLRLVNYFESSSIVKCLRNVALDSHNLKTNYQYIGNFPSSTDKQAYHCSSFTHTVCVTQVLRM
jgi:hypothetical protein